MTYETACIPDRWRVFGLRLRPYAIGHALAIGRAGGGAGVSDLLMYAYLCSLPAPRAMEAVLGRLTFRGWFWLKRMTVQCVLRPSWSIACATGFLEYQREATKPPKIWQDSSAEQEGTGAPELGVILHHLRTTCGYTYREALTLPMRQALWDVAVAGSVLGNMRFVSEDDQTMIDLVKRMRSEVPVNGDSQ